MVNVFKLFLLFLLLYCFGKVIAQSDHIYNCQDTLTENGSIKAVIGGKYKPSSNNPGEYFRALIVFAEFSTDVSVMSDWDYGSLPDWASDLFDNTPSSNYTQYSVSDYFKKMSVGDFDFIADIHPNIITVPTEQGFGSANQFVIGEIDEQIGDFHRYDNWYFQDGAFHFSESNGDGFLDMLIIIYRWTEDDWFIIQGGIASLGFSTDIITHDGIKIRGTGVSIEGSGITTTRKGAPTSAFKLTAHLAHEYGHYLFGAGHTAVSGLMVGAPFDYYGGTYAMSAWERERLGYISISTAFNGQTKTLLDYVTTGDAIRISITSTEYFIIENHQKLNYFDQPITGGALGGLLDPNSQIGKGIYIWYIKFGDTYAPNVLPMCADGSWEWKFDHWETLYGWNTPPPVVAVLDRESVYRYLGNSMYDNTGYSDRYSKLPVYINNILQRWSRWHDRNPQTNGWIISRDVMGDETDAFNIGYNEIFSPWSNPSTTKYLNGIETPTNISVRLLSTSGMIKIYNTQSGALSFPPSKPQNIKVSVTPDRHPKIIWNDNLEPDISEYRIYRSANPTDGFVHIGTVAFSNPINSCSYIDYTITYRCQENRKERYTITGLQQEIINRLNQLSPIMYQLSAIK